MQQKVTRSDKKRAKNGEKSPRKWRQKTAKNRLKKRGQKRTNFYKFSTKKTAHFLAKSPRNPLKKTSKSQPQNRAKTTPAKSNQTNSIKNRIEKPWAFRFILLLLL